jgi:hypothetical protein
MARAQPRPIPIKNESEYMTNLNNQIAFTNKVEGGNYCNDCASGEILLAAPIKVKIGTLCDDCGGLTNE